MTEDADFILGRTEIEKWEANFGPIPPGSAVLMWTGFEDRWDDPAAYLNADPAGGLHYPGFGAEVTRWLIECRSIGALGIDAMGIDPGTDTSFRSNRLLLHEHRLHLENLAGLGEMPAAGGWVIVGGIRVRDGSGSPATVFGSFRNRFAASSAAISIAPSAAVSGVVSAAPSGPRIPASACLTRAEAPSRFPLAMTSL